MNDPSPSRKLSVGPPPPDDITPTKLRHCLEFGCWTTLILSPFLYWINGPAVSADQFVVRTAVVTIAAVMAIGLRFYAWQHPCHQCELETPPNKPGNVLDHASLGFRSAGTSVRRPQTEV